MSRAFTLTSVVVLMLGVTDVASAQTGGARGYAYEGTYIAIAPQLNATLDGITFDGETLYREIGGTEVSILPKLDRRNTWRGIVGFRSEPMALEFSYERRPHKGMFLDEPFDATFQVVNVDARFFFNTKRRIQPHAVVGIAFPWLTIKGGSFDDFESPTPEVGDARWRGTGLNTELGITAFVTPRAGVSIGYAYRPIWFTTERGVSRTIFELRPRFRESSGNATVMIFATF
jgi:hypothetical protein